MFNTSINNGIVLSKDLAKG